MYWLIVHILIPLVLARRLDLLHGGAAVVLTEDQTTQSSVNQTEEIITASGLVPFFADVTAPREMITSRYPKMTMEPEIIGPEYNETKTDSEIEPTTTVTNSSTSSSTPVNTTFQTSSLVNTTFQTSSFTNTTTTKTMSTSNSSLSSCSSLNSSSIPPKTSSSIDTRVGAPPPNDAVEPVRGPPDDAIVSSDQPPPRNATGSIVNSDVLVTKMGSSTMTSGNATRNAADKPTLLGYAASQPYFTNTTTTAGSVTNVSAK